MAEMPEGWDTLSKKIQRQAWANEHMDEILALAFVLPLSVSLFIGVIASPLPRWIKVPLLGSLVSGTQLAIGYIGVELEKEKKDG